MYQQDIKLWRGQGAGVAGLGPKGEGAPQRHPAPPSSALLPVGLAVQPSPASLVHFGAPCGLGSPVTPPPSPNSPTGTFRGRAARTSRVPATHRQGAGIPPHRPKTPGEARGGTRPSSLPPPSAQNPLTGHQTPSSARSPLSAHPAPCPPPPSLPRFGGLRFAAQLRMRAAAPSALPWPSGAEDCREEPRPPPPLPAPPVPVPVPVAGGSPEPSAPGPG